MLSIIYNTRLLWHILWWINVQIFFFINWFPAIHIILENVVTPQQCLSQSNIQNYYEKYM